MRRLICLCLLIGSSALVGKAWHYWKDGFQIARTLCKMEFEGETAVDPSIHEALQQTYSYLGRGHQCYAFGSGDGKYVVKLPRFDRYRLSFFLRAFPFSFLKEHKEKVREDLERRKDFLLESFRIAWEDLSEETALIYLHLVETEGLKGPLVIKDSLGRRYKLDPNQTAFLLQEKKPIMMSCFEKFLEEGDRKKAEEILDVFLDLVSIRAQKGIYNKDPSFRKNFGWGDGKGAQIDIGSFYRKPDLPLQEACEKSFLETETHVRNWLVELDKDMVQVFDQKAQAVKESWDFSND